MRDLRTMLPLAAFAAMCVFAIRVAFNYHPPPLPKAVPGLVSYCTPEDERDDESGAYAISESERLYRRCIIFRRMMRSLHTNARSTFVSSHAPGPVQILCTLSATFAAPQLTLPASAATDG